MNRKLGIGLAGLMLSLLQLGGCTYPAVPDPVAAPSRLAEPASTPFGLRFLVEPDVAAPGALVTLVLVNGTAARVGHNLCSSSLERLDSGGWRPVPQHGVCTRELRISPAGQTARYGKRLPPDLPAGAYRFRTGVETQPGRAGLDPIFSEPFTIRR